MQLSPDISSMVMKHSSNLHFRSSTSSFASSVRDYLLPYQKTLLIDFYTDFHSICRKAKQVDPCELRYTKDLMLDGLFYKELEFSKTIFLDFLEYEYDVRMYNDHDDLLASNSISFIVYNFTMECEVDFEDLRCYEHDEDI